MKRIFLINPENDKPHYVPSYGAFPPLGILSIASTVMEKFRDEVQLEIWDGQKHSPDHINRMMERFEPDIVGISTLSNSYNNAICHARFAKEHLSHAKTILGNDHAAEYGENILRKNWECVDYICTADVGEISFCEFLRVLEKSQNEDDLSSVPELMFRKKNGEINKARAPSRLVGRSIGPDHVLDEIPVFKWYLIQGDMNSYAKILSENWGDLLEDLDLEDKPTAVTINRARGCGRGSSKVGLYEKRFGRTGNERESGGEGRCLYCGIADLEPRTSSPRRFWEEVISAKEILHANIFYEVCDSLDYFYHFHDWIPSLVTEKKELQNRSVDLNSIKFYVYSNAAAIVGNPRVVGLL